MPLMALRLVGHFFNPICIALRPSPKLWGATAALARSLRHLIQRKPTCSRRASMTTDPTPSVSMFSFDFATALYFVEALATMAFAASGVLEAARRRLDVVGVCVVACLSAFGGGTLRDLLLDKRPFFWVAHFELLLMVLVLAVLALVFMRRRHFEPTERVIQIPDAIGLGLFAASGTQIAMSMQMPTLVSVLMGVMTAAFGGVLRDVFCSDIPKLFHDHRPYAICAFIAGWVVVACDALGFSQWITLLVSAATGFLLRLVAIAFNLRLPGWRPD